MVHCGPGLACPMRLLQVLRGVTKPRGPSDANKAFGARLGIFGLEWKRLQMRPPLGKNGDFPENEGGHGALGPGLAGPMRFWQVPRGVTKTRGPSDAYTARGARWGIFGLEWPRLQMRPPLGKMEFSRK